MIRYILEHKWNYTEHSTAEYIPEPLLSRRANIGTPGPIEKIERAHKPTYTTVVIARASAVPKPF